MHKSSISFCAAAAILAGCSGVSTDTQERQTYSELAARFFEIDDQFEVGNISEIKEPDTLPEDGLSTYRGVLGANIPDGTVEGESLIGQMTLNANFATDSISGDVRNFVDENEAIYTGQLIITDGEISRDIDIEDTFTFIADLTGDLNSETEGPVNFDTRMRGDFYGDNHEFVGGELIGDITTTDGTFAFDGPETYFVGER